MDPKPRRDKGASRSKSELESASRGSKREWSIPLKGRNQQRIDELCAAAGFKPRIVLESERTQAVLAMVAAENGIGMFTETITRLIDRGVVFLPLNNRKAVLQHTLVWQVDKSSEALLAFQKVLRRHADQKPTTKNQMRRVSV